jgi:hypothetical protein
MNCKTVPKAKQIHRFPPITQIKTLPIADCRFLIVIRCLRSFNRQLAIGNVLICVIGGNRWICFEHHNLTLLLAFLSMTCPLERRSLIAACRKIFEITHWQECCIAGTYVNGRRLPLQGRGWGFESLRAYHHQDLRSQISDLNRLRRLNRLVANIRGRSSTGWLDLRFQRFEN